MKSKVLAIIISISFIISFFLTCLDFNCFNLDFYKKQYSNLNVAETISISEEGLMNATVSLLDYLKDKRDNLDIKEDIHQINREVFNQREKDHMVDVKNLYLNAMDVRNISFIILIISLIIYTVLIKKDRFLILSNYYLKTLGFMSFLFSFIIIYILLDFNSFWTNFHHVFFTNDLWLLDPRVDVLIMMVPEEFFNNLVLNITLSFITVIILLALMSYFYRKRALKND